MTLSDAPPKPRRFYKAVTVEPQDGGHGVRLDGRAAKTPGGGPLVAPTAALAQLIATEWDAQATEINLNAMPVTRLAFTALDRGPEARAGLADEVARYADSDLLCYLAEEPRALVEREAHAWGPWLRWADKELGVRLTPAVGLSTARQAPEAIDKVRMLAASLDDFALTGLVFAAGLYGSAVLAFAVARAALSGDAAYELSRLDEAFQEERWGVDAEAAKRTERLGADARLVDAWFDALRR